VRNPPLSLILGAAASPLPARWQTESSVIMISAFLFLNINKYFVSGLAGGVVASARIGPTSSTPLYSLSLPYSLADLLNLSIN